MTRTRWWIDIQIDEGEKEYVKEAAQGIYKKMVEAEVQLNIVEIVLLDTLFEALGVSFEDKQKAAIEVGKAE